MNPSRLFMLRPVATSLLMLALLLVALVPKLQLGNPVSKALGNRSLRCSTSCIHAVVALRDGKLELPKLNSQAGAWELANHVHSPYPHSIAFNTRGIYLLRVVLVPKFQLGNPMKAPALRDGKLELPKLNSQTGAWELANHVHLHHLLFIIFNTRVIYLLRVSWSWTRTLQS